MLFWTIRRTSRRSASPDRIAAVVSSCSRSRRVTGWHPRADGLHGAVSALREPVVETTIGARRSALARSCVLLALRFLALPLHRRLLVVLTTTSLGEDPALLDLLVEATEGALERLVLTHSDFGQSGFTSSGSGLRTHRSRAMPGGASGVPAVHSCSRTRPAGRLAECTRGSEAGQT